MNEPISVSIKPAAGQLEFGIKSASEVAMELGVSGQTVSREMKRRGVRKNALLHLSVAEIERYHASKARQQAMEPE